ncbi:hypothetical protein F4859DRAFT_16316 [Xylaria cf. heliscus]|nr:hypothetical protein F4859DRAFT_16316 [Xylaria cf. heliscus]
MPTQTIMKLFTLLTIPIAALAAPEVMVSKRFGSAPFAPGTPEQGAFDKCSTEEHHKGNLAHPANMLDCLDISAWAKDNNGMWTLDATTDPNDDNDWQILRVQGSCALVVKNTQPTSIGNKDVMDLIEAIHLGDGIELGSIEELGTFHGCQAGVDVSFWLRGSDF